jgi:nitrile hydratase accessory protein
MYQRRRNLVRRPDGRLVNVARPRGQLFVCAVGCCCGRTEDGFAAVPSQRYHDEWERRRLRNIVHLTIGGCLGPCALANVVLLLFDGRALWFHSINSEALVLALYDHIEEMLEADAWLPPPSALAPYHFSASAWQPRPDGQPVDDLRPRHRGTTPAPVPSAMWSPTATPSPVGAPGCSSTATLVADGRGDAETERLLGDLAGRAAVPRRNGELVFEAPWQGRVLGMAVALSEQGAFSWEEFRGELVQQIAEAEARGGEFRYYDAWLAAFERVLARRGLVGAADLDEITYQFEFGERDDVF